MESLNLILKIIGVSYLVILVYSIILMFSFKIFEKAKQKNISAFIPIYNLVIFTKICEIKMTYSLLFFIPIINVIFFIYLEYKLSVLFKTSKTFYIGMIFIPFIFLPSIAFGKQNYKEEEKKMEEYLESAKEETPNLMSQKEIDELNKKEIKENNVDSLFKSEWETKEKPPMYKASTVEVDPEFSSMEVFEEHKIRRVRPVRIEEIKKEPEVKERKVESEDESIEIVEL